MIRKGVRRSKKGNGRPYPPEIRKAVINERKRGYTQKQIAQWWGISQATVHRIITYD